MNVVFGLYPTVFEKGIILLIIDKLDVPDFIQEHIYRKNRMHLMRLLVVMMEVSNYGVLKLIIHYLNLNPILREFRKLLSIHLVDSLQPVGEPFLKESV